jgi:DNA-binding MarR family transcriptional regulator
MIQETKLTGARARSAANPLVVIASFLLSSRRRRTNFLQKVEFGEPAWDMLLDLYIEHSKGRRMSTHNLCEAAMVPASTALRWISAMVEDGQLFREPDPSDRRRIFVSLTPEVLLSIEQYLREEQDRLQVLIRKMDI